jgi:hypothetical protein
MILSEQDIDELWKQAYNLSPGTVRTIISSHREQAKLIDELKKRIEELKLNSPPIKTDEQVRAEMDAMQAAANEAIAKIYDSQAS